jgi:predicted nucleotidyltransferase
VPTSITRVGPGLEHDLRQTLARGPEAAFVVVFGSEATGKARADSDLDLAWLPLDRAIPLARELELQAELTHVAGREVDLVRVDHASTVCAMEIARDGRLLAGDRDAWVRFRAEAIAAWLDYAPALHAANERFRLRLAAGSPEISQ